MESDERPSEPKKGIASDFDGHGLFPEYQCRLSNEIPCTLCNKMENLETQMLEAKRVLDDLVRLHSDMKKQMNHVHDPITSRMPPEVVSSIFQFCMPPASVDSNDGPRLSMKKGSAPLILGAVCTSWREIAWSTPRLWTALAVCINAPGLPARCDLARQWLVRSGGLSLTVHIYSSVFHDDDYLASPDTFHPLIELVNQYSSRWYSLDLSLPDSLVSQFCGDLHSHSILHTLKVNSLSKFVNGTRIENEGQFSLQNVKPSPTRVYLSGLRFKTVDIEWNSVTQVEIGDLQVDEIFELLKRASHLRSCKLSDFSNCRPGQEHFPIPTATVSHPQLCDLDLEYPMNTVTVSFLCENVSLPALKNFTCTMSENVLPIESLSSLFKRSSCVLQELFIMDAQFRDDDIIDLLRATPSLLRLNLLPLRWSDYSPDSLFKLLAGSSLSTNDDRPFLPNLRFLLYHVEQNLSWTLVPDIFGPLSELNDPRCRPLRSVRMHFYRDKVEYPLRYIDKDTIPRLLSILDAGLDLEVTYPDEDLDLIELSIEHHNMVDSDADCLPSDATSLLDR